MSIVAKTTLAAEFANNSSLDSTDLINLLDSAYQGYLSKNISATGNGTHYIPLGNISNSYTIYKIYVYGVGGSGAAITSTIDSISDSGVLNVSASSANSFANTGYLEFFNKTLVLTSVGTSSMLKVTLASSAGTWSGGVLVLYEVNT